MSGVPKVIESLHGQIAGHLATIRELRLKVADLEQENGRLTEELERLRRDNRWLEDQLFEEGPKP